MREKRRKKRAKRPKGTSGFPSRKIVPPGTPVDHLPWSARSVPVTRARPWMLPYLWVSLIIGLLGLALIVTSMVVGSFARPDALCFYGGLLATVAGGVLAYAVSIRDMRRQERRQQPSRLSASRW